MTQAELQALAAGRSFSASASTPAASGQTIIVSNPDRGANDCIPCEEGAGCSVSPTNAVTLDYSRFQTVDGPKLRWAVSSTATVTKNIVLLGNFTATNESYYTSQVAAIVSPSTFTGGVSVGGSTSNVVVSQQNLAYHLPGAVISRAVIRFPNTDANAALQDLNLTAFRIPADPNNSVARTVIYDPFCDYCVTTNTSDYTTHAYTITAPIDVREGLVIPVPAGTSFTLELCYGLLSIPNMAADKASNQWNG